MALNEKQITEKIDKLIKNMQEELKKSGLESRIHIATMDEKRIIKHYELYSEKMSLPEDCYEF